MPKVTMPGRSEAAQPVAAVVQPAAPAPAPTSTTASASAPADEPVSTVEAVEAVEAETDDYVEGNSQPPERRETLAINLFDLGRLEPKLLTRLFRVGMADCVLDMSEDAVVLVDKNRLDETAVPFTCDLLQAACICDTIRSRDKKLGVYPTRVYLRKVEAWERLPADAVLAVVTPLRLNPKLFPPLKVSVQPSNIQIAKPVQF